MKCHRAISHCHRSDLRSEEGITATHKLSEAERGTKIKVSPMTLNVEFGVGIGSWDKLAQPQPYS